MLVKKKEHVLIFNNDNFNMLRELQKLFNWDTEIVPR